MKLTNGKVILLIATIHTILTPMVYQKQFREFMRHAFFKINNGFSETTLNYETFAAFWCLYFGLTLFPLGILLDANERASLPVTKPFLLAYLILVLIGTYMIPSSGITLLMLPHAISMLIVNRKRVLK